MCCWTLESGPYAGAPTLSAHHAAEVLRMALDRRRQTLRAGYELELAGRSVRVVRGGSIPQTQRRIATRTGSRGFTDHRQAQRARVLAPLARVYAHRAHERQDGAAADSWLSPWTHQGPPPSGVRRSGEGPCWGWT